jgi:predicted RNA binding protein YcfA (HicA-like mRNA interferase family)
MRYTELIRRLRRLGFTYERNSRGSHEIWWDATHERFTMIPSHPGREIAKGTLAKILKDLGLREDELNR